MLRQNSYCRERQLHIPEVRFAITCYAGVMREKKTTFKMKRLEVFTHLKPKPPLNLFQNYCVFLQSGHIWGHLEDGIGHS